MAVRNSLLLWLLAVSLFAAYKSQGGVLQEDVLLNPNLLRMESVQSLQSRLLPWEFMSLRYFYNKTRWICPTEYNGGLKPCFCLFYVSSQARSTFCANMSLEFGSCCLNSFVSNGGEDRSQCFADLSSSFFLLPPRRQYSSMLDAMRLMNQRFPQVSARIFASIYGGTLKLDQTEK